MVVFTLETLPTPPWGLYSAGIFLQGREGKKVKWTACCGSRAAEAEIESGSFAFLVGESKASRHLFLNKRGQWRERNNSFQPYYDKDLNLSWKSCYVFWNESLETKLIRLRDVCPANTQEHHSVPQAMFLLSLSPLAMGFCCSVQSLKSCRLFVTPWTEAHQVSLSPTILPKLMSIESVMPCNRLILCHPLLLLPSIFPSIRIFSNELAIRDGLGGGIWMSPRILIFCLYNQSHL